MRIGFDAKRAFFNRSGLGNYSRNLINGLQKFHPNNNYILFSPTINNRISLQNEDKLDIISPKKRVDKIFSSFWRSKKIASLYQKHHLDIYHGLSHELPFSKRKRNTKLVVTIHDLIFLRFPEFYKPIDRIIHLKKVKYSCKTADVIVAISEQTKQDLIDFIGVDERKIQVIYQGCNPIFEKETSNETKNAIREKYNLPHNYLLYVGTIERRKNLLNLVKGIHEKDISNPLVVVGRKTDYFDEVMDYINSNQIDRVFFLSVKDNEDLPPIYQMAKCFIYPSLFEGFGIPVLEALFSKTPVITSIGSCFSEAGGPNSIYIDPANSEEIGNAILSVLQNQEKAELMIQEGLKHANSLSEKSVADNYISLYKNLIQ